MRPVMAPTLSTFRVLGKTEEEGEEEEEEAEEEEEEATRITVFEGYRRDDHQNQYQYQYQHPPAVITQQRHQESPREEVVEEITPEEVIRRIEDLVETFIEDLNAGILPNLYSCNRDDRDDNDDNASGVLTKRFTLQQCRSYTSLWLVLSFCHSLLLAKRTTTLREVYYYHVTHFRSQSECNVAIAQVAQFLQVPRHKLGLKASPRGWFCGDIQLVDKDSKQVVLDGRGRTSSSQGYPITSDWLLSSNKSFLVQTAQAQCILVIEKEGIFQRLVEDAFFQEHPCILVTSRGFPDWATRAMVATLHVQLRLPVCGLADCNPYGVSVLHTFLAKQPRSAPQQSPVVEFGIPHIHWIGLRPSQVQALRPQLPQAVFQQLTPGDEKRAHQLLRESSNWIQGLHADRRLQELEGFLDSNSSSSNAFKVELEALNWLGLDYLHQFLGRIFDRQDQKQQQAQRQQQNLVDDDDEQGQEWLDII